MLPCVPSSKEFVLFCISEPLSPCESALARGKDSHEWLLPGHPDTTPLSDLYTIELCSLPAKSTIQGSPGALSHCVQSMSISGSMAHIMDQNGEEFMGYRH